MSPRDGLQNEKVTVALGDKVRLIDALVAAGLERIEVTSFVSPKWIPQLADADDLVPALHLHPGVRFSALCPNAIGLERAREAKITEIAVFVSASETHKRKNVNKSIADTLAAFNETIGLGRSPQACEVRGYVSTVWGCPYEGAVDPARALAITERLVSMGCYQVSLGDTIGVGTPRQTQAVVKLMLSSLAAPQIALHMHDTRGTALVNILVGLELRHFRVTSTRPVGGLGGGPYAAGAAGNCATEDIVYMRKGMGVAPGIDLERVVEAGRAAESIVGAQAPRKGAPVGRAKPPSVTLPLREALLAEASQRFHCRVGHKFSFLHRCARQGAARKPYRRRLERGNEWHVPRIVALRHRVVLAPPPPSGPCAVPFHLVRLSQLVVERSQQDLSSLGRGSGVFHTSPWSVSRERFRS